MAKKRIQRGLQDKVLSQADSQLGPSWSPKLNVGDFADKARAYFNSQPVATNVKIIKNINYDTDGTPYPAITVQLHTREKVFDAFVWDTLFEIAEECNTKLLIISKEYVDEKVVALGIEAVRDGDEKRVKIKSKKRSVYHG